MNGHYPVGVICMFLTWLITMKYAGDRINKLMDRNAELQETILRMAGAPFVRKEYKAPTPGFIETQRNPGFFDKKG